jgi:bacterioferritin
VKGNKEVLRHLQAILTQELTAINQYFLHYGMMEHRGYHRLAQIMRRESIDEMKHAEEILERMLYLEGAPDMTSLDPLRIGKDVRAQLENDLAMETEAVVRINQAIDVASQAGDNTTRELLEQILLNEEKHVDFLEAQLHQIGEMGYERYLAEQMGEPD